MAQKKETLIAEAQKLLQKGQADRAIKGYQEAVALDPADLRVRQRLAELLVRANRLAEARTEFETVGTRLATGGFNLKAIAVYRQLERLFPDDIEIVLTLADLNRCHGLLPNALAEYKRAFDHFEVAGNSAEGARVLGLMQQADPQNVNIRLKHAEVLYQAGDREGALSAFNALAGILIDRRDSAAFARLAVKMGQLFDDQQEFTARILREKIIGGGAEQAVQILQALLREAPQDVACWRLVIEACHRLEQWERLKQACRHLLHLYPSDIMPREYLVRCLLRENDATEAHRLLREYEPLFRDAGACRILLELYRELDAQAAVDPAFLQELARQCAAAEEAARPAAPESPAAAPAQPALVAVADEDDEAFPALPVWEDEQGPETDAAAVAVVSGGGGLQPPDEELFEIDVDLEEGDAVDGRAVSGENWFETVSGIFDTVRTDTGTVKFGGGLENADYQSHFDLGVAFREMGLFDDAIAEFRLAAAGPGARVRCLAMQGACLREKGEPGVAEHALRTLLASPDLSVDEEVSVKYELALTLHDLGRGDESRAVLEEVERACPGFRDTALLLQGAAGAGGGDESALDFSDEDLQGFDLK